MSQPAEQLRALQSGHTIALWTGEWYGTGVFMITLTAVRRNDAGIWLDGTDPRGQHHRNLLVHPWAERHIEERWRKTQLQLAE